MARKLNAKEVLSKYIKLGIKENYESKALTNVGSAAYFDFISSGAKVSVDIVKSIIDPKLDASVSNYKKLLEFVFPKSNLKQILQRSGLNIEQGFKQGWTNAKIVNDSNAQEIVEEYRAAFKEE